MCVCDERDKKELMHTTNIRVCAMFMVKDQEDKRGGGRGNNKQCLKTKHSVAKRQDKGKSGVCERSE